MIGLFSICLALVLGAVSSADEHTEFLRTRADAIRGRIEAADGTAALGMLDEVAAEIEGWDTGCEEELEALRDVDRLAEGLSALAPQIVLRERILRLTEEHVAEDDELFLRACSDLAVTRARAGQLEAALELFARVLTESERRLPEGDREILRARGNLATALHGLGRYEDALLLEESVVAGFEALFANDDPDLINARGILAATRKALGDLHGALALETQVLEGLERRLSDDDLGLWRARANRAQTLYAMGDYEGALEAYLPVVEAFERLLPPDHPELVQVRAGLAAMMRAGGDLEGALALQEQVLHAYERLLPASHPALLFARGNLAGTAADLGDWRRAYALEREVLAAFEDMHAGDHPDVLRARHNLANAMMSLGDPEAARDQLRLVLAAYERTLPSDHPSLVTAMLSLATASANVGDLELALELEERVLAAREDSLPHDHPSCLIARIDLAATLTELGNYEAALELLEETVPVMASKLSADHPAVRDSRANLAAVLGYLGHLERARSIHEEVLAQCEQTLDSDDPELANARGLLASTLSELGELEAARELYELALVGCEELLPAGHPDLLDMRLNVLATQLEQDERAEMGPRLAEQIAGQRRRLLETLTLAPREARARAVADTIRIERLLFLAGSGELLPDVAGLVETRRHLTTAGPVARAEDASALREPLRALSRELNDLVLAGPSQSEDPGAWRRRIVDLSGERDELQEALFAELSDSELVDGIDAAALARSLRVGAVAVGYLLVDRRELDAATGQIVRYEDEMIALVFRRNGAVLRVDLGPADAIRERVRAWKAAIGVTQGRGTGVAPTDATNEREAGAALRRAILDPVLTAADMRAGGTLHACLDGRLHLVPLDALPLDGEERVGDRYRVRREVSFGRLLSGESPGTEGAGALLVGDIDFDAVPREDPVPARRLSVSPPHFSNGFSNASAGTRGSAFGTWERLPGTAGELELLGTLHEDVFGAQPSVLRGAAATKRGLAGAVRGKRFVHLATHGWFAPDEVLSITDRRTESKRLSETVRGFAPMTLCGLSLAGANRGANAFGRVPGLLTAEELSTWNLTECELAVLSACDTNVGISRAGQGLLSLQVALHAAGARTTVTSLWSVPDAQTADLMGAFYESLWTEGMGKADALWAAKTSLRERGEPVAAWAAWVLTGDPR